jgi:ectoine hydroxylase-related dioxygenase (phytanoyl-CoA dioxygenase family)
MIMDTLLEQEANETFLSQFQQNGVVVVKNIIAAASLHTITEELNLIRSIVMPKLLTMQRPIKTYSDIAERHLGRLDYRCGFKDEVFHQIAQPVVKMVNTLSPTIDFRYYWGAIPSLSGSGPTDMHRDVYPLLNTEEGMDLGSIDLMLPPYYFTVLIPLVEITAENGPTQFISGSFTRAQVAEDAAEIYAPLLVPGDIVIFDGRTMHKGSANRSKEERVVAYITFVANWYHDQTFELNEFLFPELN